VTPRTTPSAGRTLALVESPAQLLNVLEWAHQTGVHPSRLSTVVLAPRNEESRRQLRRTADLAAGAGHSVRWSDPRRDTAGALRAATALAAQLHGVDRLVVGDPFSGLIQLLLGLSRVSEVVVVDDGTASIEFARLWAEGQELVRWHRPALSTRRRRVAALAQKRIGRDSDCRLTLFTAMPVGATEIPTVPNTFSWVRSFLPAPDVRAGGDLIGTSLVETGVVDAGHYLAGVQSLARDHAVDRYLAHRKEGDAKLARIAAMGLRVVRPDLPLELVARREEVGRVLISFPSTVVHTLPLVLADTPAQLLVCDIASDWYAAEAPEGSNRFLGRVTTSARDVHGLLTVAC
jgi:hypothetical protein